LPFLRFTSEINRGFTAHDLEQLLSIFDSQTAASPNSNSNSGSEGWSNRSVYDVDERKERRMKSNRESARRSRWRKKRHLEKLTEQAKRLKVENQELKYMLGSTLSQCHVVRRENQRLRSESVALRGRLTHLCHTLLAMHGHAVNNGL
ncbi:Basic leucine zipper 4, partial [Linum grandiflorum]